MPLSPENPRRRLSDQNTTNEFKKVVGILFRQPEEDYKYKFPEILSSRSELDRLKPRPHWVAESLKKGSKRALWSSHGDGHIARSLVFFHLLTEMMAEGGTVKLTKDQKAAIELSVITHDLKYNSDKFETILAKRMVGHQRRAANQVWLRNVFSDLAKEGINSFSEVSPDIVIPLASQINRVHDYRDNFIALSVLKKDFPDVHIKGIPLELEVFRDIDAGLERLRTEELFKRVINRVLLIRPLKKIILNSPPIKSPLRRLHFPLFEETRRLLPFAMHLYNLSIKNPEYKIDQWKATMNIAQMLGAVRA